MAKKKKVSKKATSKKEAPKRRRKPLKNGACLIVLDSRDRILMVREKTRKQLLQLPGGEVDRGESPRHAAQSETEEETGIVTDELFYRKVGEFVQRPNGVVFLYETRQFDGEIDVEYSDESSEAMFMTFDEIMRRGESDVRTATLRMLLRWMRCTLGIDQRPYEGSLREKVELPRNYRGLTKKKFERMMLAA